MGACRIARSLPAEAAEGVGVVLGGTWRDISFSTNLRDATLASLENRIMLQEVEHARQIPGEPFRRWFTDSESDLILWYDAPGGAVTGFQLCYNKGHDEHALTWVEDAGFTHRRIDDGEGRGGHHKMTPVLLPDGVFDSNSVLAFFARESREIDPAVVEFVTAKIRAYPEG